MASKKGIAIVSRENPESYDWLIHFLLSIPGLDVRPIYLTNANSRNLIQMVSKCTFAILYHSKSRGRINVTDVPDSLYDQELKELSKHFGREKVMVVIDDLADSSLEEKRRLLEKQPSIETLAQELFLFTNQDKVNIGHNPDSGSAASKKLKRMKNIIEARAGPTKKVVPVQKESPHKGSDFEMTIDNPGPGKASCWKRYAIWIVFFALILLILVICVAAQYRHKAEPISSPLNASTDEWTTVFSSISLTTLPFLENLTLSLENATTVPENFTLYTENATTVPENFTLYTENATTVPENFTLYTENATTVPENFTLYAENATTVPENFTLYTVNATTVPENITLTPELSTTIPVNVTTIPVLPTTVVETVTPTSVKPTTSPGTTPSSPERITPIPLPDTVKEKLKQIQDLISSLLNP
ncbi:uncharacterized protein LOC101734287 isoform X2 [Xenopus tropicalis]|uniref:Uncharacterized LOC101734287 n=1 Tax=Xenopus tropicalis TaxID=8364 RepID=A0A6I8QS65_XENTR|nr:uncharacterized protein LOC101734287 isoform X1 [Xenopus tropicalis]XP_031749299.1 uncharacterized protein LOC101734287 isoform X2 [Xenopus tropicalis]|eukprot:XP_004918229.1 PREDICTED: uncharacterized protein LOC101734287 [Xenopus tropicalis]